MLAVIRTLGPVVALVLGLAGGGTLIGAAAYFYNVLIDNPQVAKAATDRANDACTIRVQAAAHDAEAAERARQQVVTADALRAYQEAVDARQKLTEAMQDQLQQQEIDYEKKLSDQGRSCTLDDNDLEFLRGK
jgi:hypothetical protein